MSEIRPVSATLDCIGLLCPEPLFRARTAIDALEPGEVLEVLADLDGRPITGGRSSRAAREMPIRLQGARARMSGAPTCEEGAVA